MIDDGLIALTARKKLLERAGYSVLSATDGESGLRLFESNPLDLVLINYYIPGGGTEIRQRMKAARPTTPIVISEWRNRAS
jgi:CheY-like chemotaxis protein